MNAYFPYECPSLSKYLLCLRNNLLEISHWKECVAENFDPSSTTSMRVLAQLDVEESKLHS